MSQISSPCRRSGRPYCLIQSSCNFRCSAFAACLTSTGSASRTSASPSSSSSRIWRSARTHDTSQRSRARPDVRTHIPPLGAGQNRRCTTRIAAPRLAEHPGRGLPVSRDGPASLPECDCDRVGWIGIRARRPDGYALCVNLDAMRVKGLVWRASPPGVYAAAVVFFAQTWVLRWPSMRGTPWNWQPGTATGSSYSARPSLLRVLPQPRRQQHPAARGGRPGSGERRVGRRRR
jgi:hypothetical protein